MDTQADIPQMLELITSPAFMVRDGHIIYANHAAAARLVPIGKPVATLISIGADEYRSFTYGRLYLEITIEGIAYDSYVTSINDAQVFSMVVDSSQELQVLALAAKELRDPLNRIMAISDHSFAELCQDEKSVDQISRVNHSLYQILRTLNNMSDAGTHRACCMELQDISSVMQELFDQASVYCQKIGIELTFKNLSGSLHTIIDAAKLERAVFNIISNSMKFIEPGGYIHAELRRKGLVLYLTIQDSGPEKITADSLGIFDQFLREPCIEDPRRGLGLGMTLVRNAALAHGGTVLVQSQKGQGLRITMSIPIRQKISSLRSPKLRFDYTGERDHSLTEFADSLPYQLYRPNKNK